MADPWFEEAYEYLSEDGSVSDECIAGRAAFRPKRPSARPGIWMVPNKEPNTAPLAAMKELEEGRGERFDGTDVEAFFAECDQIAGPEKEPDWEEHLAVINRSRGPNVDRA